MQNINLIYELTIYTLNIVMILSAMLLELYTCINIIGYGQFVQIFSTVSRGTVWVNVLLRCIQIHTFGPIKGNILKLHNNMITELYYHYYKKTGIILKITESLQTCQIRHFQWETKFCKQCHFSFIMIYTDFK